MKNFVLIFLVSLVLIGCEKPKTTEDIIDDVNKNNESYKNDSIKKSNDKLSEEEKLTDIKQGNIEYFKNVKEKSEVEVNYNTLRFSGFKTANKFIFDRYGGYVTSWFEREAKRDNTYLLSTVNIKSESKDPKLPQIVIFQLTESELKYIGWMTYEFYKWRDYGAYLGNYNDNKNDFAYTANIKFELGTEISKDLIKNEPIIIAVRNENILIRRYERFNNPPVWYEVDFSTSDKMIAASRDNENKSYIDFENGKYTVLKIFNRNKIK